MIFSSPAIADSRAVYPEPLLTDYEPAVSDFRAEVLQGLSQPRKRLPCKFFYDQRGSQLFDRICELDEYYPTRTELRITSVNAKSIARRIGPDCLLVEYGSGSSLKTRVLLDHLQTMAGYVPIDISREHLMTSARSLAVRYPQIQISPVCADYTTAFELPVSKTNRSNVVAYFPGSTIGNFEPADAANFLRSIRESCGAGSGLLIGVDLKKDPVRLHTAYNDSKGVTAEFNLNLLHRINRELGGNFQTDAFAHYAPFFPSTGRMEMHLVSLAEQSVSIAGRSFSFEVGESIHSESCCKYTLPQFETLAASAGYRVRNVWTDEQKLFSLQLLTAQTCQ